MAKEAKALLPCTIEGCPETTYHRGPCRKCKSGLYYWKKKRPAQRLARIGRLKVFQHRIEELI